jgi:DNA polymerase-3 subunit beta
MKIECSVADLCEAVGVAGLACDGKYKGPLPLDHVLLSAKGEELEITATNLQTTIIVKKAAKVGDEGSVTVPFKRFSDILKIFPKGKLVSIAVRDDVAQKKAKMKIECDAFKFTLQAGKADDFPAISRPSKEGFKEIEKDLYGMFSRTEVAISRDDDRTALTGMYMAVKGGNLVLAATNGRRLSLTRKTAAIDQKFEGIVSGEAVDAFLKFADDSSESSVSVGLGTKNVAFTIRNIIIIAQLLQEKFPDVEKVIPDTSKAEKVKVSRTALYPAVEAAGVVAKDGDGKPLSLMIVDNEMEIDSRDDSTASAHVTVKVEYEGKPIKRMVDSRHLLAILGSHMGDELELAFLGDKNPIVLTMTEDKSFVHLIVPMNEAKKPLENTED